MGGAQIPTAFQDALIVNTYQLDRAWNDIPTAGTPVLDGIMANVTYENGTLEGRRAVFSGANSYHQILDNADLSFGNGVTDIPFTQQYRLNPTNLTTTRFIFGKRAASSQAEYQAAIEATTGKINLVLYSQLNTAVFLNVQTNAGISAGVQTKVTFTYDGSGLHTGIKIYFNNVEQAVTNLSSGSYVAMNDGTSNLTIAHRGYSLATNVGFLGSIEQPAIWRNKALTQEEIEATDVPFDYNYNLIEYYQHNMYWLANSGNYVFGTDNTAFYWSTDRGKHWTLTNSIGTQYSGGFPVKDKWPEWAYIFDTGTLIWANGATMYRSTDGGATNTPVSVLDANGDPYPIHTPVDPLLPGSYFSGGGNWNLKKTYLSNGAEIVVFTNSGNVPYAMGASPTVVWESHDDGVTINEVFTFGYNSSYRDDGTRDGGNTGVMLGNLADTTHVCRHGHQCYQVAENTFIVGTGDTGAWMTIQFEYSIDNETWTRTDIIVPPVTDYTPFACVGYNLITTELYYNVEGDPSNTGVRGVFTVPFASLISQTGETQLNSGVSGESATGLIIRNGRALQTGFRGEIQANFRVFDDVTFSSYTNYLIGGTSNSIFAGGLSGADSAGFVSFKVGGFGGSPLKTVLFRL